MLEWKVEENIQDNKLDIVKINTENLFNNTEKGEKKKEKNKRARNNKLSLKIKNF